MINYISDYYSFDPMALYNVMKTLITDGYAGGIIDANKKGDWKLYVTQSIAKVQKNYGFAPIYVNYCFQCLAYGAGLYPSINQRLLDELEGRTPTVVIPTQDSHTLPSATQPQPSGQRKAPSQQDKQKPTQRKTTSGTKRQPQPNSSNNWNQSFPPFQPTQKSTNNPTQNNSQKQQISLSNGCGCSGCLDGLTNTYVIIIIILWLIYQCNN